MKVVNDSLFSLQLFFSYSCSQVLMWRYLINCHAEENVKKKIFQATLQL